MSSQNNSKALVVYRPPNSRSVVQRSLNRRSYLNRPLPSINSHFRDPLFHAYLSGNLRPRRLLTARAAAARGAALTIRRQRMTGVRPRGSRPYVGRRSQPVLRRPSQRLSAMYSRYLTRGVSRRS